MNRKLAEMASALRTARRVILAERREQFMCFTIPPDRAYDVMSNYEKRAIRRFDRALAKIDAALALGR